MIDAVYAWEMQRDICSSSSSDSTSGTSGGASSGTSGSGGNCGKCPEKDMYTDINDHLYIVQLCIISDLSYHYISGPLVLAFVGDTG